MKQLEFICSCGDLAVYYNEDFNELMCLDCMMETCGTPVC